MSGVTSNDRGAGDPPGRIAVTGGGVPTAEQLAALVVALTPTSGEATPVGPAPWRRAALLEGTGHPTVLAASDLDHVAPSRR